MSYRIPKFSYWQDAPMPRNQLLLFASTLEERIPLDHPVRLLDEILDELDWTKWEAVYVGKLGQPPIHPSILCKVLLFALSRRIRSSRQIEYAVEHSIDFIWLTSGRKLDHSTLSEFRRKNEKELKDIYRQMIQLAISMKVAKLSELCIDGTKVRADASRSKTYKRERMFLSSSKSSMGKLPMHCPSWNQTTHWRISSMMAEFQEVRERQAERMQDATVKERYKARQHYGETPFAIIKSNLGVRRFLLRGHTGVVQEWRWSCLTFNLKKLMTMWPKVRTQSTLEASTVSC